MASCVYTCERSAVAEDQPALQQPAHRLCYGARLAWADAGSAAHGTRPHRAGAMTVVDVNQVGETTGPRLGHSPGLTAQTTTTTSRRPRRLRNNYKHIPHREKAPQLVARRNARERRRVQAVNSAFIRLRRHVPIDSKQKRLSKVKTLRHAIDYIQGLQALIKEHDQSVVSRQKMRPACMHGAQRQLICESRSVQWTHTPKATHEINANMYLQNMRTIDVTSSTDQLPAFR